MSEEEAKQELPELTLRDRASIAWAFNEAICKVAKTQDVGHISYDECPYRESSYVDWLSIDDYEEFMAAQRDYWAPLPEGTTHVCRGPNVDLTFRNGLTHRIVALYLMGNDNKPTCWAQHVTPKSNIDRPVPPENSHINGLVLRDEIAEEYPNSWLEMFDFTPKPLATYEQLEKFVKYVLGDLTEYEDFITDESFNELRREGLCLMPFALSHEDGKVSILTYELNPDWSAGNLRELAVRSVKAPDCQKVFIRQAHRVSETAFMDGIWYTESGYRIVGSPAAFVSYALKQMFELSVPMEHFSFDQHNEVPENVRYSDAAYALKAGPPGRAMHVSLAIGNSVYRTIDQIVLSDEEDINPEDLDDIVPPKMSALSSHATHDGKLQMFIIHSMRPVKDKDGVLERFEFVVTRQLLNEPHSPHMTNPLNDFKNTLWETCQTEVGMLTVIFDQEE